MTPEVFKRQMTGICAQPNFEDVRRDAVALIKRALGENVPAYLPSLYRLFERAGTVDQLADPTQAAPKKKRTVFKP